MSVVAIPFRSEDPDVVRANLAIAASHPRVDEVWAVYADETNLRRVAAPDPDPKVRFVPDERVGALRPGKGDGMNTALLRAAESGVDRLHFYDADITNFNIGWIEGAEKAADNGFEVVRHRFPRAATDAMITWFITRPSFAIRFPRSVLPRISQPLGGELLLGRAAISDLASNEAVIARSDWGIDTAYTFWSVAAGHSLFEHQVPDGKRHSLYGSLDELREMAVECLDAVRSLPSIDLPGIKHESEADQPVPRDLATQIGYSVASTTPLLEARWADREREALDHLPPDLVGPIVAMQQTGKFDFLDDEAWERILRQFLDPSIGAGDGGYQLFFRLWVGRVLHYTSNVVVDGYERAMSYLTDTVETYRDNAESRAQPPEINASATSVSKIPNI